MDGQTGGESPLLGTPLPSQLAMKEKDTEVTEGSHLKFPLRTTSPGGI